MLKKLCWPATVWWGVIASLWNNPEGELDNIVVIWIYILLSLFIGASIILLILSFFHILPLK